MQKSKLVVIILILCNIFLDFSCHKIDKKVKKANSNIIHFDVSNWNKNFTIPEKVINQIRFIPLETARNILIGNINKILLYNDNIYVLDIRFVNKILVYNSRGKYLNSIGNIGRGPGEYISINDFNIDEKNKQLLILDGELRKILSYNLEDSGFLSEIKINFWAMNFAKLSSNIFTFYSKKQYSNFGNEYSIANLNLKNNSCKWYLKKNEFDTRMSSNFSIFQSKHTYFTPFFKDTVYNIMEDGIKPYMTFNFGKNKIPGDRLKKIKEKDLKSLIKLFEEKDWTYNISNFMEGDEFISFDFVLERKPILVIYSKKTGKYFYGAKYDGPLAKLQLIRNIAVNQNEFAGVIDAVSFENAKGDIIAHCNTSLLPQPAQTLKLIGVQSNPIIILIKYNSNSLTSR